MLTAPCRCNVFNALTWHFCPLRAFCSSPYKPLTSLFLPLCHAQQCTQTSSWVLLGGFTSSAELIKSSCMEQLLISDTCPRRPLAKLFQFLKALVLPRALSEVMVSRQTTLRSQMKIVNISKTWWNSKKVFCLVKISHAVVLQ